MASKILVLGTSNSLLRDGYLAGFCEMMPPNAEVINSSVGASPGVQFAGLCARDLKLFDFVIFDSVVNDENLGGYVGEEDYYSRLVFEMFSTIAAQTRLIVLGFCNERHFLAPSGVFSLHRRLAEQVGGVFVSVRDFAAAHRESLPEDEMLFDKTGTHFNLILARAFGRSLARSIETLPARTGHAASFAEHFATVDLTSFGVGLVVDLRNSMFARRFVRLTPGEVIDFQRERFVIGFYADEANTRGYVRLKGANDQRDKSLLYGIDPTRFVVKFIPVKNGMSVRTIEAIDHSDRAEISPHVVDSSREDNRQISLASAVCWNRP